jgi:EAL domain-containing protein (putative c-di-GMP-specific phosphodiesterase class I)/GGDEF domain-containing protein
MTHDPTFRRKQLLAIIDSPQLSVHFQPIVDLHDGLIVAYEALTRIDPSAGFAHAGELFEAAEREGLLWELERITRRNSIEAAANWPRQTKLFLNCTPAVFADERFADQLAREMQAAPDLRPDRIVLEITELSDEQYIAGLTEQVRAASAAGFTVALDDAGAGASGLNRMMTLRPQWVKLDREFVRGIDTDHLRQNLVRFFVHFARLSGVSVVAEGIESATELQTVTSLGVRFAQGFYLGRPGTRTQTMDAAFVADLRKRWAAVEASVPQEMLEPTLGAICRTVGLCPAEATVGAAVEIAARFPELPGVLVMAGTAIAGWLPRTSLESRPAEQPLRECRELLTPVAPLPAALTVNEAVTALCTRDEDRLQDPVVVSTGETIHGVIRLRDLLRVAATDGRLVASGRARMTGLPTRVRADQHITGLLHQIASGKHNDPTVHTDAALIDIRSFAEFNNRRGGAKGDALIRELAELISAIIVSSVHDAFVAHLGDDRFLLTGADGTLLPHLHRLATAFDEQHREDGDHGAVPALRIFHLPGVLLTAKHPRDIYRTEQRLREQTRERDASTDGAGGSYVFVHGEPGTTRRAA